MDNPLTVALVSSATVFTAVMCCARSPGFGLFARIFVTRTGLPVKALRATVVLRICPPPSPLEPSIVIIVYDYDP